MAPIIAAVAIGAAVKTVSDQRKEAKAAAAAQAVQQEQQMAAMQQQQEATRKQMEAVKAAKATQNPAGRQMRRGSGGAGRTQTILTPLGEEPAGNNVLGG